jgi:predicted dehydrogenase
MKTVKFGIIGAGRLGNTHAGNLDQIKEAEIAGVYDIKPEAAEDMREKYGAKIYHSAEELAGSPDIDCVIVTSPTYCHLEGIRAAVSADKPLFCEKPLVRTKEDIKEALKLLENYPKVFSVGFVRRYMAKAQKIKELISDGLIGKLRFCNVDLPMGRYKRMYGDWFADFEKCGGVIIDMLAHHVDLANWFLGEAQSVYAQSMLLDPSQELPSDYVSSVVKYKSGVICNLMCSWQRFGRSNEMMEIYGEKGALVMDGADFVTYYNQKGEKEEIEVGVAAEGAKGVEQINSGNAFLIEMQTLTDAVNGASQEGMPTIKDAVRSLEIGLAMIESSKNDSIVKLPLS